MVAICFRRLDPFINKGFRRAAGDHRKIFPFHPVRLADSVRAMVNSRFAGSSSHPAAKLSRQILPLFFAFCRQTGPPAWPTENFWPNPHLLFREITRLPLPILVIFFVPLPSTLILLPFHRSPLCGTVIAIMTVQHTDRRLPQARDRQPVE